MGKIAAVLGILLVFGITGYQVLPSILLKQIQKSHIEGNAPEDKEFDLLLTRDLQMFFKNRLGHEATVDFEYLRKGATQSGVAYPKYYLWVKVTVKEGSVEEGAIRVAAIDKSKFEITNFLTEQEIISNPSGIHSIFPEVLCPNILERAKQKVRTSPEQ